MKTVTLYTGLINFILESSAIFKTDFLQLGLSINGIPYPIRASFYILIDINITELFPFYEKNYCRMINIQNFK